MSSTPSFDALLPTLLASLPPAEPYAIHLPLLCAVLSRLNEPQAITTLFDATVDHLPAVAGSVAEPSWSGVIQTEWTSLDGKAAGALVLAVRIREALLKSFPLLGFPLTISALTTFSSHLAESHPEVWKVIERLESTQPFPTAFEPLGPKVPLHEAKPTGAPGGKEEPLVEVSRGRRLFNSIYGKVSGRVIESLRWGHPNLVDCALKLIYTPVLSDARILTDPLESSLLCLVLCFSSDLPPQTKGHFHGAMNLGADRAQLEPLLLAVWRLVEWAPAGRLRIERMDFLSRVGVVPGALDQAGGADPSGRSKI